MSQNNDQLLQESTKDHTAVRERGNTRSPHAAEHNVPDLTGLTQGRGSLVFHPTLGRIYLADLDSYL